MAARSYDTIFLAAAAGYALSFLFMLFFTKETLTGEIRSKAAGLKEDYSISIVLKDRIYILSVFLNGMIYITSAGVFNLLSVYAVRNLGIPESSISIVFTVNALMCVTLQLAVIRLINGMRPMRLMCVSGLLYMAGVSSIALIDQVWWFCICMAVMTLGELIMSPTMSDLAVKMAPENARGRYMSVLSLARPFGQGIGPALLGYVNDMIAPRMMWVSGALFAGISALVFCVMDRRNKNPDL